MKKLGLGLAGVASLLLSTSAFAADSLVGFQTFEDCTNGNRNSGVCETNPQSNSTYDATPQGSIGPGNLYLTAVIGPEASSLGRKGRGQNINNTFLNGEGFGNEVGNPERFIVNVPLYNGDPGFRFGPYDDPNKGAPDGTSSWKFSMSDNERAGDVRLVNHSDYYFKLTFINFDARVGNVNSPHVLQIKYLSGNGTDFDNDLIKKSTGAELNNLVSVYNNDFLPVQNAHNVSRSLGEAVNSAVYIPPGKSAAFRLLWSDQATNGAESQIDNFAFQGEFYETAALETPINPAWDIKHGVPGPGAGLWWLLSALLAGSGFLVNAKRKGV